MIKKFFSFFLLLFAVSCLLSVAPVYAKDYSITSADFKVQLNSDGSARMLLKPEHISLMGIIIGLTNGSTLVQSAKFKVQSSKLTRRYLEGLFLFR